MRYKVVTGCQFEACPWNGKGTDGGHVVPAEMDMGSQPEEDESPWGKHGQGLYDGLGGGVEEEEQEVDQGAEDAWEACLAKLGRERRAQADGARMGDDLFEEGEESGDQDAGSGDDVKVKPPLGLVTSERGSFRPTHEFMAREFPQFPSFPFFQDGSGRIGALKNASKFTMACSGQLRRYADQPDKIERLLNLQLQVFSTRYVFHKVCHAEYDRITSAARPSPRSSTGTSSARSMSSRSSRAARCSPRTASSGTDRATSTARRAACTAPRPGRQTASSAATVATTPLAMFAGLPTSPTS
ncbi:hypothetical protein DFJ74DRAFT_299955 [Hyaloraphidium curvatum]|nr:hypothetical protein DFJ74DRAFT_299955 [Hyaloraphidium curvatum]